MSTRPIVVEEMIDASVEAVWEALTDRDKMSVWYFDIPDFELTVGAMFNFYEPGPARKYHHQGLIQEIVPARKLQHTWTHPSHSKGSSVLAWELTPIGEKTKVRLTHSGIENFADAGKAFERESYEAGWNEIVGISLKDYLEK